MMNYAIYKNARNASWQCLIDCNIRELPVKPIAIAKHYGITCKDATPEELEGAAGKIIAIDGHVYVLIDSTQPVQRRRFTVVHELGHYLLGHLGDSACSRSESECRPEEEQAADRFAADLLMPACVLWGLGIRTAEEIAQLCNVSMQAAQIRAERMAELYRRNKFLLHPLEQKVYAQFGNFIQNSKQR